MGKRIFAAILCLCMAVALLPQAAVAAATDGIQLGTGGIEKGDSIFFGKYGTYDIPWIVLSGTTLSEASAAGGTNALPMLSRYLLGSASFGTGYYAGSPLKDAMNGIYNGFAVNERNAVADATLSEGSMLNGTTAALSGQKLFPLSHTEAASLREGDGFLRANNRTDPTGNAELWWLRTSVSNVSARRVSDTGYIGAADTTQSLGVRPAMYLDLSKVLFISNASGGKSVSGMDSGLAASLPFPYRTVAPGSRGTNIQWKLTLKDAGRSGFSMTTVALSGASATVRYSGAKTGTNEYISAVIVDNGNVTHYGRVKSLPNAGDDSGTVTIAIPSGVRLDANTQLQVFNEQFNGDRNSDDITSTLRAYTDYASELKTVIDPGAVPIPTTGDDAMPGLWAGILFAAAAALTVSIVLSSRKRKTENGI